MDVIRDFATSAFEIRKRCLREFYLLYITKHVTLRKIIYINNIFDQLDEGGCSLSGHIEQPRAYFSSGNRLSVSLVASFFDQGHGFAAKATVI